MAKKNKVPKSKLRKTLNVITTVVSVLFVAILAVAILCVVISKARGEDPNLFGFRFLYILTDSMEPDLPVGTSIVVKNCKAEDVKVGDYVTFISEDKMLENSSVKLVTHKCIKALYYDEGVGAYCIQTQGIKEGAPVDAPVKADNVQCKFISKTPAFFSRFINFLITPYGIVVLIALPLIIGLGLQMYTKIKAIANPTKSQEELEEEAIAKRTQNAMEQAAKGLADRKDDLMAYINSIKNANSSSTNAEAPSSPEKTDEGAS
ncbi:MAG: signal peptidase I [Clostridia bacterium]|nr:signal peptidase I [Clostridia bacterium]